MALSPEKRLKIDNGNPVLQESSVGTEIGANQDNITAILAGKSIVLPTSDPGVAGELWADTLIVTVSAGA